MAVIRTNRNAFHAQAAACDAKKAQLVQDLSDANTQLIAKQGEYEALMMDLEPTVTVKNEIKTLEASIVDLNKRLSVADDCKKDKLTPLLPGFQAESDAERAEILAAFNVQMDVIHAKRAELLREIAKLPGFDAQSKSAYGEMVTAVRDSGKDTSRLGSGALILSRLTQDFAWSTVGVERIAKETVSLPPYIVNEAISGRVPGWAK